MEEILQKLVAFPSVTSNRAANAHALDYIAGFVAARGMHVTPHEWNGVRAIIATTQPGVRTPAVMLAGHIDVVPAPDELFKLRQSDGKFFGRGVLDMKGAIAAYLQIIDDLAGQGNLDDYDFGLMITTDEEVGGHDGTARLVAAGYVPQVCILPDGGADWQVQVFSKGILHLTLEVTGHAGHASQPWLGTSATMKLMEVLHDIKQLFPEANHKSNTLNVGVIHGGHATNQIADHAEAQLDIRTISDGERHRLLTETKHICARHEVALHIGINDAVTNFSLDNPYIKHFAQLITEVTGIAVYGSNTAGSSDARFFAARGIPCVSLYPTGGGHHGPDEWVEIKALEQLTEIITRYVEEFARGPAIAALTKRAQSATI